MDLTERTVDSREVFRALPQKQLPQPFAQQADAAAYTERPKAVCQKRRVRPGLLYPPCVFLRCHLHLPAPPFADSLPGAAGAYPFFVKEGRFYAFFPSP